MKSQRIVGQKKVVSGAALIEALGFGSARAFQRARQAGKITVPLYPIPGQSRGFYALQTDLDQWASAQASIGGTQQAERIPPKTSGGAP